MKGFILAIQFLTRIPVPLGVEMTDKNICQSVFFFPWISFLIGLIAGGVFSLFQEQNREIAALFSLITWIFLTGGLHLDGFCDTIDGFFSGRSRERVLEIMRDSLLGSFGVLGLVLLLLWKFIFLKALALSPFELAMICGSSRIGVYLLMFFFPNARGEGLGNLFQKAGGKPYAIFSAALFILMIFLYRPKWIILPFLNILVAFLIGTWSVKKISGVTGDVFGFAMEFGEAAGQALVWGLLI